MLGGGAGHLGRALARGLGPRGHEIVVLSRGRSNDPGVVHWDGRVSGTWAGEVDGADAVINLAGRSVNCRYSKANLREMMDSRVLSTRAVGLAIEAAAHPPRVWLQMSTATIYAHRFDAPNDEAAGHLGGDEPDAPAHCGPASTSLERGNSPSRRPTPRPPGRLRFAPPWSCVRSAAVSSARSST